MADKGWRTITLPESLLMEVQKILDSDVMGYKSRSEFIKEAIRQRIIDLKKTNIYEK
jgi:metal-responsive CopG/Arc/MetJ family transcriptional regulator